MFTASIVAYHTRHADLRRLVECVMRSEISRLWIIDHSSNDELRETVANEPRIGYVYSQNRGYGSGHNIAIAKAIELGADYHFVLNPDVYWNEDVLGIIVQYMEKHRDVGQLMPQVLYPNGATQYLCKLLPTPWDLIGRRFVRIRKVQQKIDYRYEMRWNNYDTSMDVPVLSGCFMALRCSVIAIVGGFDERFFMYGEDLDLCRRIGTVSRTLYWPKVSIFHEYAKGSYKGGRLLRYHITSIVKYFNKWGWFCDKYRRITNRKILNT